VATATAVGAKCIVTVQEAPMASFAPHVVASWTKTAMSVPPRPTVTSPETPWPVLVTVKVCVAELVPWTTEP
jgi:hypothetical protein